MSTVLTEPPCCCCRSVSPIAQHHPTHCWVVRPQRSRAPSLCACRCCSGQPPSSLSRPLRSPLPCSASSHQRGRGRPCAAFPRGFHGRPHPPLGAAAGQRGLPERWRRHSQHLCADPGASLHLQPFGCPSHRPAAVGTAAAAIRPALPWCRHACSPRCASSLAATPRRAPSSQAYSSTFSCPGPCGRSTHTGTAAALSSGPRCSCSGSSSRGSKGRPVPAGSPALLCWW